MTESDHELAGVSHNVNGLTSAYIHNGEERVVGGLNFWTIFGPMLGSILGPKVAPKGDEKLDPFLGPTRVQNLDGPGMPQDGSRAGVRQLSPLSGTSK